MLSPDIKIRSCRSFLRLENSEEKNILKMMFRHDDELPFIYLKKNRAIQGRGAFSKHISAITVLLPVSVDSTRDFPGRERARRKKKSSLSPPIKFDSAVSLRLLPRFESSIL